MTYQIVILGHSKEAHNDQVKTVAVETVKKLRTLGHENVSLSGYSTDVEGGIQLVDADVDEDER